MEHWVLITGATGGLGKAFAVECASRGWNVFLTDLRAGPLEMLAGGLRSAYGVEVQHQPCDLTDPADRARLFEAVRATKLHFHGLVNVAGLDYEGSFYDRTSAEISTIIRLNIEATLDVTHALLERRDPADAGYNRDGSLPRPRRGDPASAGYNRDESLPRPRRGDPLAAFHIITIASLAAFFPMPVKATYAASKRFLLDFSLALREEVRPLGATVTVVCPAGLPTTPECIRGIEAQGLMGHLTTQNVGTVAAGALDYALKGRTVYVPGLLNRALLAISRLAPPSLVAALIGWRWRAAHQSHPLLETKQPGKQRPHGAYAAALK